jgi:hypothetical protein
MDPEIDKVGRSYDKIGVGYVEKFKRRCGRIDLGFRVLSFPHKR